MWNTTGLMMSGQVGSEIRVHLFVDSGGIAAAPPRELTASHAVLVFPGSAEPVAPRKRLAELAAVFEGPLKPISVARGFRVAGDLMIEVFESGATSVQVAEAINEVRRQSGMKPISASAVRQAAGRVLGPWRNRKTVAEQQTSSSAGATGEVRVQADVVVPAVESENARPRASPRPEQGFEAQEATASHLTAQGAISDQGSGDAAFIQAGRKARLKQQQLDEIDNDD